MLIFFKCIVSISHNYHTGIYTEVLHIHELTTLKLLKTDRWRFVCCIVAESLQLQCTFTIKQLDYVTRVRSLNVSFTTVLQLEMDIWMLTLIHSVKISREKNDEYVEEA